MGIFCAISRAGRRTKQMPCLHEQMVRETYGEQRERETRSVSSLLMQVSRAGRREGTREMWIWLVLLYGVLKGVREIVKKKALEKNSTIEVLFMYTFLSFVMVLPSAGVSMGVEPRFYFYVAMKSFVIFLAWMCSFRAIKRMPISLYGVLDLSRVLFATMLGVIVDRKSVV